MDEEGTLSIGTRLGEFEIRGLVGIGGFGIVYRAFDHDLEREVAIKEYMPGLLASRGDDGSVQPRGRTHGETFGAGLRSFMLEAKMLARFDHPALVKVFRYWEGNGTAYMVMPLYQGQTLAQTLRQMPAPPGEVWLMGVLVPLLGALETLHAQHIYHRDVSPDNILLLRNGRPVLLDFGAARQVISDRTQTLTAILKPNYAPIEQYAEMPSLRQGPWTDLYALGAVVHACLTGKPPPPAAARTLQDEMVPLPETGARLKAEQGLRYSDAFLQAWQQTLAVHPDQRPRSVEALMRLLGLLPVLGPGDDPDATRIATPIAQPGSDPDRTVVVTGPTGSPPGRTAPQPPPAAAPPRTRPAPHTASLEPRTGRDMRIVLPGMTQPAAARTQPAAAPAGAAGTTAPSAGPEGERKAGSGSGSRAPMLAGLGGAVLLAGAALLMWPRDPAPDATTGLAASAASALASAPTAAGPASAPLAEIITEEKEPPAPTLAPVPAPPVPPVPPVPPATPAHRLQPPAPAPSAPAPAIAAPRPAPAPVPAPASRPPASAPPSSAPGEAARPSSPEEACGGRVLIARDLCIQSQCRKPEFQRHPTCTELQRRKEEEERRELYR